MLARWKEGNGDYDNVTQTQRVIFVSRFLAHIFWDFAGEQSDGENCRAATATISTTTAATPPPLKASTSRIRNTTNTVHFAHINFFSLRYLVQCRCMSASPEWAYNVHIRSGHRHTIYTYIIYMTYLSVVNQCLFFVVRFFLLLSSFLRFRANFSFWFSVYSLVFFF